MLWVGGWRVREAEQLWGARTERAREQDRGRGRGSPSGCAGAVQAEMPRQRLALAEEQVVSEARGLGCSRWTGNEWELEKQWNRGGGLRGLW